MSEQVTKDLGGITAYAAAVAAGYTGTKAQFETLMASYATVAQNAAASATAAANSKSDAEAFAKGTRNGTPVSSGDAAYENNSKYFAEQAGDYAESLDPDTIARVDGYYDTLGAGTAEQLTSNIYEEDSVPYNFRTSGGSIDIGDRETDMLVGGSVVWNQQAPNTELTGAGSKPSVSGARIVKGHKYLFGAYLDVDEQLSTNAYISPYGFDDEGNVNTFCVLSGRSKGDIYKIGECTVRGVSDGTGTNVDGNFWFYMNAQTGSFKNLKLFDLTQMFGSTIADYIYSLEQANAGAGVAWFKKLFPKPYYAYNAGELMSVNTSAHNTVGFNAWDEEWEVGSINRTTGQNESVSGQMRSKNYIRVLPNTQYYLLCADNTSGASIAWICYDANKNFISSHWIRASLFTTPLDCHYIRFTSNTAYGATYKNDICINLSWDGERDGEYEPYVKHSYPLDSSLTLRGIPKLDSSNNLYYDGDTYDSDGTVTRKYGIVDLGTLNWIYIGSVTYPFFRAQDLNTRIKRVANNGIVPNNICDKYITTSANTPYLGQATKCIESNVNGDVNVYDPAYTDAATFKAAMSGVYLVYELATPTTETADPYTNPQIVNDFGTEEYVDYAVSQGSRDVAIPVGHETQYMENLKAKLEMSPNSPEGAGDYIVRQTNGENEYVTLASNATIQNIIARLEALEGGGE